MNKFFVLILIIILSFKIVLSQQLVLGLNDVIDIAKKQSPKAILVKHQYRGAYWAYKSFKAGLLPRLDLNSTLPEINRTISKITMPDGTDAFIQRSLANSSVNLTLTQKIGLTNSTVFLQSNLQRIDIFSDSNSYSYMSSPISVGFIQPLLGFNEFAWQKKLQPLKYTEAQQNYLHQMEQISIEALEHYFNLLLAQLNVKISKINLANNDTLYKIAKGRYNIGKIAENELLQMELSYLNSKSNLNHAILDLELKQLALKSFLAIGENQDVFLEYPQSYPKVKIKADEALKYAQNNNAMLLNLQKQIWQAEENVAQVKAENRFNANLMATYGLTQSANNIETAYKNPQDQQYVAIGIQIPILDWGQGKGQIKMAESNLEVIKAQTQQQHIDFEKNILLKIAEYNMQTEQLKIAMKSDTVARQRYEIAKQRFLIGKINITDLNIALSEKDAAQRAYLESVKHFWQEYFLIRQFTLYDFINNSEIKVNYEELLY